MDSKKQLVLFISPAFFGYEISIKDAIEENGFEVDYFDERTSNKSFLKAMFRANKALLTGLINKYYKQILQKIKNKKYGFFLLIKGEVVPEWFIIKFKMLNPGARLVYYTYDSFKNNNSNSSAILMHFNQCYSFDFEDVKNNNALKLKHLFYTREFLAGPAPDSEREYSISFVGTLHSNRYSTIKSLFQNFEKTFTFYFLPAKWWFLLQKMSKREHIKIKRSEVSFDKLSRQQVADIFKSSKSVLDIQRFGQTGLTMRTFEVLAAGAILITTNPYIKSTNLYDGDKIIVLESTDLSAGIAEIKHKIDKADFAAKTPDENFGQYFVNNWVKEFFA